ncbi:mucin-desulfating sulfatase (n-acetylglucosamine-6-sulfatase) [Stagonosporopsis vannaccii]|nr:mucin-desulfating sulfatase (n-acetylglucosamine-6-sulfatase) [Stagonosporopsis vannaccii]
MVTQKSPNIVFIMADDHASKSISCYGAGINHTPNLDRIANEGMLFNHCYVTNSICTPSRAAILTGTHNHVNLVMTLASKLNSRLPNVAKHLQTGGYQTAMVGKWHLGEGSNHQPTGFDYWSVVPGQGEYFDPLFIEPNGTKRVPGYVTDVITNKSLDFIRNRDKNRPFFVMCHHKAPHRSWECDPKHKHLYRDPVKLPDTFTDDYKSRARAAKVAKMRIADDITYHDLGLVQPDGGREVGEKLIDVWNWIDRKIPNPEDVTQLRLIDKEDGTVFSFETRGQLAEFKYQRYMQRYLRTIQSIDDNTGRLLDYLDEENLAENTIVIYTSDQGFFLGEHGWFDKRFMYEESFQMPLLVRWPKEIQPQSVCNDIVCNVDFAPLFLDCAGLKTPSYMQGVSFRRLFWGERPEDWQQIAYHRYWMHNDVIHNAYAHYGVRDQRYKLIYWYNEDFGLEGAKPADADHKEWELFDCVEDPLELFNVYNEPAYKCVVERMTRKLETKMAEIGDTPVHRSRSRLYEICQHVHNVGGERRSAVAEVQEAARPVLGLVSSVLWVTRHLRCLPWQSDILSQYGSEESEHVTSAAHAEFDVSGGLIQKSSLPSVLLLAVCGAASRFLAVSHAAITRAKSWIDAAESKMLKALGETKPYHIEALMILGFNRRCNHQSGKTFFFVSLAARMAYHLKLHRENYDLPFIEQERRRRLVWCIFTVDRFCAGGIQEYIVLSTASLQVQLPCAERYFETNSAVKTCSLIDTQTSASELSLFALMLRLFDIRSRVLRYAKVHLESSISPGLTLTQFKGFEQEFKLVYEALSPEQLFSSHAFALRAFSPERTSFIMFHIYFHHCHCELYRLLNPGYREALHESVIDSTNIELVVYAQTQCLKHAIAIGEIIAATHQLVDDELYISDAAIFVMLYQASCAILYACHRDSPAFAMSPATAQRYFADFIDTLSRLLKYFPRFSIYVEDIRNMLRSITEPNAPLPRQKAAVEVDFRARPITGSERSDSDECTVPTAAERNGTSVPQANSDLNDKTHIFSTPPVSDGQTFQTPPDETLLLWPYLGTVEYDLDPISDPNHGLLWDWADALGSSVTK